MKIAAYIFFVLGIAVTIFLFWFTYIFELSPTLNRKWVQVSAPIQAPVLLKLGDSGEIIAEIENGGLYEFSLIAEHSWQKVTEPSGEPAVGSFCGPIIDVFYISSSPPGKVKSQVSESCTVAETGVSLEVALLENGEIWYLETVDNTYARLAVIILLPIGIIVDAFIFGIGIIFLLIHSNRKKSPSLGA